VTSEKAAVTTPVFIGVGANVGDALRTIHAAWVALAGLPGSVWCGASEVYRSAPLDAPGPDYLNAVAMLQTQLSPHALLTELQRIEQAHGRQRPYHHAPRTLDLDLLLYGDHHIRTPTLTVPHPRGHERAFVLVPLAQIAPDLIWPGLGSVANLLIQVAHQHIQPLGQLA
jgi:2-amino-4-hydroxy-6-hydroxymethyldihydropteridine diphosphokinase